MTNLIKTTLFAGLSILSVSAMMGPVNKADASEFGRGGVQIAIGDRDYRSGGHYEIQTQQVMVSPERHVEQIVPAVYETRYDRHGHAYQEMVRPARTETICIPARYETVQNRVWVQDSYYNDSRPGFFSLIFGGRNYDRRGDWGHDRHDRDHRR